MTIYFFSLMKIQWKFWLKYAVTRKISFLWQIWTFDEIIIFTEILESNKIDSESASVFLFSTLYFFTETSTMKG